MKQDEQTQDPAPQQEYSAAPEADAGSHSYGFDDEAGDDLRPLEEVTSLHIEEPNISDLMSLSRGDAGGKDSLEEIAEDMLDLLKRVQELEEAQRAVFTRLDALAEQIAGTAATQGRKLHALHQELFGERKALASLEMFSTVVQKLDSFRQMLDGLDSEKDARIHAQLEGLIAALEQMLRSAGFAPFHVEAGEGFDSSRMECVGYTRGAREVVLAEVRRGYLAGETVVRPAGVLIADPAAPEHEERAGEAEEQPRGGGDRE